METTTSKQPPGWREEERRELQRFPYGQEIAFGGKVSGSATALDFSEGGVGVTVNSGLQPGTSIEVLLLNRSVAVSGVVWHHKVTREGQYRVGIRFDKGQPDVFSVLREMEEKETGQE